MGRLASHALVYGLGSMASQALNFVLLPLYTRVLEPEEYGVLALIASSGAVVALVGALGIHSGLTRIFFLYEGEEARGRVAATALAFGTLASAATLVALELAAPLLAPRLFEVADSVLYWRYAAAIYSLGALRTVAMVVLQVHQRPRAYVACNLTGLAVSLTLTIVLVALAGRGVRGVLEGQLAGTTVELLLATAAGARHLRPSLAWKPLREMLAFALPLVPTNLAGLGIGVADRFMLKTYAGLGEVGLYALGYRLGSVLEVVFVHPFAVAWPPFMFSVQKDAGHRELYARVLEYFAIGGAFLVLGASLFAPDLLRVMSAPAYRGAEAVVFWIAAGFLVRGMTFITIAGVHIERKSHYAAYVYTAGFALDLALLAVLVPRYGALGAAAAVLLTYTAITIGIWQLSQRVYPVPYRPLRVAAILGVAAALYLASRGLPAEPALAIAAAKAGILAAFAPVLLALRLIGRDDLARVRDLAASFRARRAAS
jgi:O-antigen/teichoic acid export membrane protein